MWNAALAARFPQLRLEVVATDVDPTMLRRAREASYEAACTSSRRRGASVDSFTVAGATSYGPSTGAS
jgi:chemotaxis methyl-accepting protein methylase